MGTGYYGLKYVINGLAQANAIVTRMRNSTPYMDINITALIRNSRSSLVKQGSFSIVIDFNV